MKVSVNDTSAPGWTALFLAWLVAAGATLAALFLGEVVGLTPCVLCWWQRIFMFPLALLLPFALFPYDPRVVRYALPLVAAGAAVAFYHSLLAAGVIPEAIRPCTQGVPCADPKQVWFGFITLPLLSLAAFAAIGALLLRAYFSRFHTSR